MIASLTGTLDTLFSPYIIIDVHGVGYKVYASSSILSNFQKGTTLKIYTYTHVREDILELYGFATVEELRLFELLISVNGIGPKTASGIFSIGKANEIVKAIADGDIAFFTEVPRLGKKNAQKIIIELRSKIGSKQLLDLSVDSNYHDDLFLALRNFGFEKYEIEKAVQHIKDHSLKLEDKMKIALKYLGK